MNDLISRQAANEQKAEKSLLTEDADSVSKGDVIYRADAIRIASGYCHPANIAEELRKLPSAEPEIIQCKDCKHWTNNIGDSELRDNYCNEKAHGFFYRCSGDDYCSFAERRSDG